MSGLTQDQQKRLEENRRIAQERLTRKRSAPLSLAGSSGEPRPKRPIPKPTSHDKSHDSYNSWSSSSNSSSSTKQTSKTGQTSFVTHKKQVTAVLTLMSPARFKVSVPYDGKLIELFKQIPSKKYDASTQIWSFGLQDYEQLVKNIKDNLPYIILNLIPKPVLNTFLARLAREKTPATNVTTPPNYQDKIAANLLLTLMEFQKQGIEYCIQRNGRCLLADDMGLGKTLQAIAVVCYYHHEWPLLVVCPSSVKVAWAEAFKRWVPTLSEDDINIVMTTKCTIINGLVNIISYDLLTKTIKQVEKTPPLVIIADESHFLKNYKTARAKAALPLIKKAKRALLLSGTPALSRPIELYTQISSLDKSFSLSLYQYGQRYCNGVQNNFGWDFSGSSNMLELQLYMEEKLMIRRIKSEVLDQLPAKRRQTVLLDPSMTKGHSRELKELKTELNKITGLERNFDRRTALLPLFSKTGIMKLPAIKDYILDQLEGDRKLLVFAHHRIVMDGICEFLTSKKYRYVRIDGQTSPELRQTHCDRFQHDNHCKLAILSITAANTGLTLTAASCVIFAELFWNPGVLVQAEDRAYRIGQHNSVNIHYLVACNTADDFIWPMVQKKLQVLTEAGLAIEDFSEAESTPLHELKSSSDQQLTLDDWIVPQDITDDDTCIAGYSQETGHHESPVWEEEDKDDDAWFQSLNETDLLILEEDFIDDEK